LLFFFTCSLSILFSSTSTLSTIFNMVASSNSTLEREDHQRDADFNKAMHGSSAQARGGVAAMFRKGGSAKQAAVDEYFKHWDNKPAENETPEERAVRTL
jgi:sterol 24-C-methyltransferase